MRSEADPAIEFRPVSDAHMPTLLNWLKEPHVRRWWGEPEHELELIRSGRKSGEADGYVVYVAGEAVGYVQSWRPIDFDTEEWLRLQPPDTIGVDMFIGDQEATGQGLGPMIVRAFCDRLRAAGATQIVIDPDADNARAVRAYRKAGFVPEAQYESREGTTLLMRFEAGQCGVKA